MTQAMIGRARTGAAARSPVMEPMTDDFESFFRGRTPALLRSAYLLTGDRHLAEDLVQDALARTFRAWRRLSDGGNPEAYVRRVMYHLQVSVWRRRRVAETLPGDLPERRDGADYAHVAVERMALRQALQSLTVRQRAVIILRYFEDRSEAEIAEVLNCRVGTVKSHASRALHRLRELMPEIDLSEEATR